MSLCVIKQRPSNNKRNIFTVDSSNKQQLNSRLERSLEEKNKYLLK